MKSIRYPLLFLMHRSGKIYAQQRVNERTQVGKLDGINDTLSSTFIMLSHFPTTPKELFMYFTRVTRKLEDIHLLVIITWRTNRQTMKIKQTFRELRFENIFELLFFESRKLWMLKRFCTSGDYQDNNPKVSSY